MKALYKNRIYNIIDVSSDVTLGDDGSRFTVSLGDTALVIDPTDKEVADADNLSEWYGLDSEAAVRLRSLLLGERAGQDADRP